MEPAGRSGGKIWGQSPKLGGGCGVAGIGGDPKRKGWDVGAAARCGSCGEGDNAGGLTGVLGGFTAWKGHGYWGGTRVRVGRGCWGGDTSTRGDAGTGGAGHHPGGGDTIRGGRVGARRIPRLLRVSPGPPRGRGRLRALPRPIKTPRRRRPAAQSPVAPAPAGGDRHRHRERVGDGQGAGRRRAARQQDGERDPRPQTHPILILPPRPPRPGGPLSAAGRIPAPCPPAPAMESPEGGYSVQATAAIAAAITFLVLFTITGNVLVIMAVLTSRSLRAPQNLFLVSLAAADILVATLIIPFSLANELLGYWYFQKTWCEIYLALDVLFCTSSIVHLCAISLDRYWSVSRAIEYNAKRTPRRIKCSILIVWTIAAVISLPPLVYKGEKKAAPGGRPQCKLNEEAWYILSSSIGSFFAPCLIMILVYLRIYLIAKRRHRRGQSPPAAPSPSGSAPPNTAPTTDGDTRGPHPLPADRTSLLSPEEPSAAAVVTAGAVRGSGGSPRPAGRPRDTLATGTGRVVLAPTLSPSPWRRKAQANREKRFTFVLAVVIGVFVLCWFPFFFLYSLGAVCPRRCKVPEGVFQFFFWIGYCNSSLNPVIYTVFNQDFRKAFRRILCRRGARTAW
ncbi:Alpha-2B adrenergic receptor [Aix galericulata]|nr:Alpha-2B adrenergic receptor [Aix galericulata]